MFQKTEFPYHVLPQPLQQAMWDVFNQTQTPAAMIFSALMVAVATAAQDKYRVQRKPGLTSNISIFTCCLAPSGNRKSTVEGLVFKPLLDIQSRLAAEHTEALHAYRGAYQKWMLKKKVLEECYMKSLRKGDDDPALFESLAKHSDGEPEAPTCPKLFYKDTTIEAWLLGMHQNSRSSTLLDDDAGPTLNGLLTRSTGQLCTLWDGKNIDVQRKQAGSFSVDSPRVSVSLQLQSDIFYGLDKNKAKNVRDSGLGARFLIFEPSSTIGTRFDDSLSWPADALERFHQRLVELFSGQENVTLTLSPDAQVLRRSHYNEIELAMGPGGYLEQYQDIGSKIPENTARVAALIHLSSEDDGQISYNTLLAAINVMAWFTNETIHIFGGTGPQSQFMKDVAAFETFMGRVHAMGLRSVRTKRILQNGPARLRKRSALNAVLSYLQLNGRCQWYFDGKTQYIYLTQAATNITGANLTQQVVYQTA